MAIYHLSVKVISRAHGSSAVASAAYRSAARLNDQRLDRAHDFSNKAGVVHSEVMLPEGAPERLGDRSTLWNEVEATELRKDAQLAREVEFAIPRELDQQQGIELAREFVQREFVKRGMIADLNVHWDIGSDGLAKPHAHVMLTMRAVNESGFGAKVRDWNKTELVEEWREAWADHVNARLASLDIDAAVDHRSLEAQGIDLAPQNKIGSAASRMAGQGRTSERLVEHHAIARENGEKLIANPALALDAITHAQASFTPRDIAKFVHRHSDDKEQFDRVMAAIRTCPELVVLGADGRGEQRLTTRSMLEAEQRLEHATNRLAERAGHELTAGALDRAIAAAERRGLVLGDQQRSALVHVTRKTDLAIVVGYAGTGKSAMLGIAREAWEDAGYRVQGIALSGIAAENLEAGSAISSRTIASLEHQWGRAREQLSANDVLVIDEAGMIGSRQMERIVTEAQKRGAKVVAVGDPEQLQAIEAGAAFRAMAERHGAIEITEIRRQREDWQRQATRHLATGRTAEAIAAYDEHGVVLAAETRDQARTRLIERWDRDRVANPGASRIILTHNNDEVQNLNIAARARLRDAGELGDDVTIRAERGTRDFARGDRVMFFKNERGLGVKNGSLGTIESVSSARMAVLLDDGRAVAFDVKDYAQIDHGYAATIHKTQGVTVDRAYLLATPGLDRHAAYVALSRHRDRVELHYGCDDFADRDRLVRTLGRERAKDMASDYVRDPERQFAERRGISRPEAALEAGRGQASPLPAAIVRHARIVQAIRFARSIGEPYTPEQRAEVISSRAALDAIQPNSRIDLEAALANNPALIAEGAQGRTASVIRAMQLETEMRADPARRADQFVERWQVLDRKRRSLLVDREDSRARNIARTMIGMAKSLERDPQLESLLRARKIELGLPPTHDRGVGPGLADMIGRGINRGLGIGR